MEKKLPISREEEAAIPSFKNHTEALKWFEEKYGEAFMISDITEIEGKDMFFCVYVIDKEKHDEMRKYMRARGGSAFIIPGDETKGFLESYQSIQISADGSVHIVH